MTTRMLIVFQNKKSCDPDFQGLRTIILIVNAGDAGC